MDESVLIRVAIDQARLSGKRELHLNGAQFAGLEEIPKEVFDITFLRILNVSGGYSEIKTKIKRIPPDIAKLQDLEVLILEKNQIAELPTELFELPRLKELYLKDNGITSLPRNISRLTSLRKLDLSKNQLRDLPLELCELKELETLDVAENRLTDLPLEIAALPKLRRILVRGNKIANVPIEIVNQSSAAVLNYCKSVLEQRVISLHEAKLLIVGEGAVGKTSLLQRIIHDSFTEAQATTEGIDIQKWTLDIDRIKDFRINIWDFGGQEIYHATHQFFLTKRSLYIFVWTARNDETNFDYWLNVIRLLSENSPVVVVLNKSDERIRMIDEHFIQKRFPNVVAFHRVSAMNGVGIVDLIKTIKTQIVSLEHIGNVLPVVWVRIRAELEKLNKNYISYRKYTLICAAHGLDKSKVDFLSKYYHDLGVFLHFQDNPILKNILFIKPEWATNAVYRIVDAKDVIKNCGKFSFQQLKDIWTEYPEEKHLHLVELMKKFELCFQLPNQNEYIIPELLQPSAPALNWNYDGSLQFEYHYQFMPSGILTRFIVINHHLIDQDLYWKNGAVFKREETKALVSSDPFTRKLQIWIDGPEKKELLSILREKMDYIHKTMNQPPVKEMIRCICSECNTREPFFFEYATLKKFYYKGKREVTCSRSAEDVSIEVMLGRIEAVGKTAEQEILEILRRMKSKDDNEESLIKKANEIIQLKPSFMGIGININEVIKSLLKKDKRKKVS
jgi:small GTP-binding protein